jgi:pimeloyl-ACP methyl ester carboxylesterase
VCPDDYGETVTETVRVPVGDLTFDVHIGGPADGRPVLLLHGFPQHAGIWDGVIPFLHAAGLRTLAPDLRGYSPDARPAESAEYGMSHLVGDVTGLLDALGISTVDLVGHDWGAVVGWQVAARHPERIRSYTAVSIAHPVAYMHALKTSLDQQKRSAYLLLFRLDGKPERVLLGAQAKRLRAVFEGSGLDAGGVARYVDPLVAEPDRLTAALHWYRAMGRRDQDGLPQVTVPVTFVWGDEDVAQGRKGAEDTGNHVTGPYRFVPLEGRSHWLPDEAPKEVADAVLDRIRTS